MKNKIKKKPYTNLMLFYFLVLIAGVYCGNRKDLITFHRSDEI